MKILVTGGAGYIGSIICRALEVAGHTPIVVDSLIAKTEFDSRWPGYLASVSDRWMLDKIFLEHPDIEATIHCAALTSVPGSVADPYLYYLNNVAASLQLFHNLERHGCHKIVFSSSASVYDSPEVDGFEVWEESILNPASPYARTKMV